MEPIRTPLNVIRVNQPCYKDWDAMTGDSKTRFCSHCQKEVHNLSAMPKAEAQQLVDQSAGHMCIRYEQGKDGSVKTLDYQTPDPKRHHGWKFWSAIGCGLATLVAGVQAATKPSASAPTFMKMGIMVAPSTCPTSQPAVQGEMTIMGDMVAPPPATKPTTAPITEQAE